MRYSCVCVPRIWKRKRLNFCENGSILKKEAGNGSKLGREANSEATNFIRSWKRKQKIFYCFHIPSVYWQSCVQFFSHGIKMQFGIITISLVPLSLFTNLTVAHILLPIGCHIRFEQPLSLTLRLKLWQNLIKINGVAFHYTGIMLEILKWYLQCCNCNN